MYIDKYSYFDLAKEGQTNIFNKNVFLNEKYAKSSLALAQISQLLPHYDTDVDWTTNNEKWCITRVGNKIEVRSWGSIHHVLAFNTKSEAIRLRLLYVMKKASEIYDPKNIGGWYDYEPMLEAFGEILIQVDCGQYQGDSYLIIKSDDKYGYLNFGWGSCSGCDALQGCGDINEVQELMDQLYSQIRWFDSLKELKEYFNTKDWELEYGWCYDDFKDFINKVINYES